MEQPLGTKVTFDNSTNYEGPFSYQLKNKLRFLMNNIFK